MNKPKKCSILLTGWTNALTTNTIENRADNVVINCMRVVQEFIKIIATEY